MSKSQCLKYLSRLRLNVAKHFVFIWRQFQLGIFGVICSCFKMIFVYFVHVLGIFGRRIFGRSRSELSEGNIRLCCFGIHLQDVISAELLQNQDIELLCFFVAKRKWKYCLFCKKRIENCIQIGILKWNMCYENLNFVVIISLSHPRIRNKFKTFYQQEVHNSWRKLIF